MRKLVALFAALLIFNTQVFAASTIDALPQTTFPLPDSGNPATSNDNVWVSQGGVDKRATYQQLSSSYQGTTPPSSPFRYQQWWNTSTTPNQMEVYDGSQWLILGYLDTSGHSWTPAGPSGSGGMLNNASNAVLPDTRTNLGATVTGGVWPLSLGGTGGTSAADALTNIGAAKSDLTNVTIPAGRDTLNAGLLRRSVLDFGAKCDVQYVLPAGNYSIAAGGTTVTLNPVTFTGSIANNIMTVTATVNNNPVQIGEVLSGTNVTAGTKVIGYGTGNGGTGTYIVSPSQSAGSATITGQLSFVGIGSSKSVVLPGHAAGGAPLRTTIIPSDATHATLGSPSVPGTTNTYTLSLLPIAGGSGYAPNDTITMAGGTPAVTGGTATIGTVAKTYARTAAINAAGAGGSISSTFTVYGTTGNGNRFTATLTTDGAGAASSISLLKGGKYTSNPTSTAAEPVATNDPGMTVPAGLTITLTMDVSRIAVTTPGLYTNGGLPATFTQASSSGAGTGATFTTMVAYNTGGFTYGTDDSADFATALNPSSWPTAQGGPQFAGAVIELPGTPCGISSTVTRSDSNVEFRGTAPFNVAGSGLHPQGSVLQWLGAVGGTMFSDSPYGNTAYNNKILNVGFSCGIPNNLNSGNESPLAGIGYNGIAETQPEFGWLSFNACSTYDMYTAGGTGNDFIKSKFHEITMWKPLYNDGEGIHLGSSSGGHDTDFAQLSHLDGSYQSSSLLYVNSVDGLEVDGVHFFQRGTQDVYGLDVAGKIYGSSEGSQPNEGTFRHISSTSIVRGLESAAAPPRQIMFYGFDTGNSVPPAVMQPGAQASWIDFTGYATGLNFYNTSTTGSPALTNSAGPPTFNNTKTDNCRTNATQYGGASTSSYFCNTSNAAMMWFDNLAGDRFNLRVDSGTHNLQVFGVAGGGTVEFVPGIQVDNGAKFAGSSSGTTRVLPAATASGTLTLPAATDTLVGKATTDTLTNKTLTSPILTTPNLGVATATTVNKWTLTAPTTASTLTAGGDNLTYTMPALSDTIVGRASTDTLTNKTLTDPIMQSYAASGTPVSYTTTVTFSTVTGLSLSLTAGKTYSCYGHLTVTASGAAGGIQVALVGTGGLTATSASFTGANFNGATTNQRNTVTALGTGSPIANATAVVTDVQIDGYIVVNVAGTINVQATQNASNGTTTTVGQGSTFRCVRVN